MASILMMMNRHQEQRGGRPRLARKLIGASNEPG